MESNKYSITAEWSDADSCYIVRVPEFPGLSAFGNTIPEAISQASVALELFVESYRKGGLELPQPIKVAQHSGKLQLRLSKSLHSRLADAAEREGVSLNSWINSLLSERQAERQLANEVKAAIRSAEADAHCSWLAIQAQAEMPAIGHSMPQKQPQPTLRSKKPWVVGQLN